MNIKGIMIWALLVTASIWMQAQGTFVIEGQVKNVDEGTVLELYRMDGDVGNIIASDTLTNGRFHFQIEAVSNETDKLLLICRNDGFSTMSLSLWALPGSQIHVTGQNPLVYTWNVESDIPQQQVCQSYIKDSQDLWDEYQRYQILQKSYWQTAKKSDSSEYKNMLKAKYDSLEVLSDQLSIRINANEIRRMKQTSVDDIWLDRLYKLAMGVKNIKDYPYKADAIALYNGLTEDEKQSIYAQKSYALLFSEKVKVVEEGDEMADADLYDLQGNIHHLADFKGKYILLDFWSRGCGPCIMALPEMKEVAEMYKDRLTMVSLSIDDKKGWEKASLTHEMTWQNLNDLKGSNGLNAKYGVRAIPNYVLISPEGRIISKWAGYSKGSLKEKLHQLLNTEVEKMSQSTESGD